VINGRDRSAVDQTVRGMWAAGCETVAGTVSVSRGMGALVVGVAVVLRATAMRPILPHLACRCPA
jgi:hypothetical protein